MNKIFEKWFDNGNKVFQIINYKKDWKQNGNKPIISFKTNGAKKNKGDKCLDINIWIGYTNINYTNYDLQNKI